MSVKELFEAEYDAAPDTGQGVLLPWHLANAVMSELTKLDSRQKLLRRIWHDLKDRADIKGSTAVELSASIYDDLEEALSDE